MPDIMSYHREDELRMYLAWSSNVLYNILYSYLDVLMYNGFSM
jgi:hypothetical protein